MGNVCCVADRPGSCGLFVVCDGHNGVTAARYVADQLPAYLDDLLPLGDAPGEDDPKGYTKWRHGLQRALTVSLALMHRAFAGLGVLAGCTVTIVLQVNLNFAVLDCILLTCRAYNKRPGSAMVIHSLLFAMNRPHRCFPDCCYTHTSFHIE